MAELKMLAGLLFALSLRSSSVEPMTSVTAAQDASPVLTAMFRGYTGMLARTFEKKPG